METGQFIKMKRTSLGLTMKDLADKVGVSEATISRWESGEIKSMRAEKLSALAKALEITPTEVMFVWDDPPVIIKSDGYEKDLTSIETAFIDRFRMLTAENKLNLMLYIDDLLKGQDEESDESE